MSEPHVVVIGTSAGGIEAVRTLAAELPPQFPAPIVVVIHTGPHAPNGLDQIITRAGGPRAIHARTGEKLAPGRIYLAPPDHHILIAEGDVIETSRGPKENRFRPAIDPLFRSAATALGTRAIGVILTGWLDDGTAGLWAIKQRGGLAVVQDPEDALAPAMPQNALKNVEVNHCVALADLAGLLVRLTSTPPKTGGRTMPNKLELEVKIARGAHALETGIMNLGDPSVFACPECHGVLLQLKEGNNLRFRCHTGHAYSLETLLAEFFEKTEESLWNVARTIDETVMLLDALANRMEEHGHNDAAADLRRKTDAARHRSEVVRTLLDPAEDDVPPSPTPPTVPEPTKHTSS